MVVHYLFDLRWRPTTGWDGFRGHFWNLDSREVRYIAYKVEMSATFDASLTPSDILVQ